MQTCDCRRRHVATCCGLLKREEEAQWKKEHEMMKTWLMESKDFRASFSKLEMEQVLILNELLSYDLTLFEAVYFSTEEKKVHTFCMIELELMLVAKLQMDLWYIQIL